MQKKSQPESFIVNPGIEEYLRGLMPVEDKVLREMEELARQRDFPIVGPLVGRFLYQFSLMTGARRIFEMGSGFGYSAYWFAKALGMEGLVLFSDLSKKNGELAQDFFRRGGVDEKIRIEVGNSLEILEQSDEGFDIIFNDIDKEYYPLVIDKAYEKLKRGGLLITDNVLWFGKVLTDDPSPSTKGVKEFTSRVLSHRGFFSTIIPVRDGISLSVKL